MAFKQPPKVPDFKRLLSQLNITGLQSKNNRLYQVINGLIQSAQQGAQLTEIDIKNIEQQIEVINNAITNINITIGGLGDVVGPASAIDGNLAAFDGATGKLIKDALVAAQDIIDLLAADLLTHSDESTLLPSSRNLLAGTNVTFDDTVANERTINVSADYCEPLTNGIVASPELIFAAGDVIMVCV